MMQINVFLKLTPQDSLKFSFKESLGLLKKIIGENAFNQAFQSDVFFPSPVQHHGNTQWSKTIKIIGINPRLTGTYWGIVKYAMTFPENAIHIMPLWEVGDRGSLYVQNSWRLNQEFLDPDLAKEGFDTCEKQLKLIVNILHAMGKAVGFDALPHVDNFAEIVFENPGYFEWAKLNKDKTSQLFPPEVDYNLIYKEVEELIQDHKDKTRLELIKIVREAGYEPVPVTEHVPCRPVVFDRIETDGKNTWAKFKVENMSPLAKIIGCITPYKGYDLDDQGYPIKNKPNYEVWNYFIGNLCRFQQEYNFDFMRCDMAHNQLSHCHNDPDKDLENVEEVWAKAKERIHEKTPYFVTLAEAFYNHYYIDGFQDMINKKFDIVLGNMNYKFLNKEYLFHLDDYINIYRQNFSFIPCICIFSHDSDHAHCNIYYQSPQANEIRIFTGLFLKIPSYMGIGFETRALTPNSTEHFSAEYVKYQEKPYKWGNNIELFENITRMRDIYSQIKQSIENEDLIWVETGNDHTACWLYIDKVSNKPTYLFALNLDTESETQKIDIPDNFKNFDYKKIFSNLSANTDLAEMILELGEVAIYKN